MYSMFMYSIANEKVDVMDTAESGAQEDSDSDNDFQGWSSV